MRQTTIETNAENGYKQDQKLLLHCQCVFFVCGVGENMENSLKYIYRIDVEAKCNNIVILPGNQATKTTTTTANIENYTRGENEMDERDATYCEDASNIFSPNVKSNFNSTLHNILMVVLYIVVTQLSPAFLFARSITLRNACIWTGISPFASHRTKRANINICQHVEHELLRLQRMVCVCNFRRWWWCWK